MDIDIRTFNRGNWQDSSPFPEWPDEENTDDYLTRINFDYGSRKTIGDEYGDLYIEYYQSKDRVSFFATLSTMDEVLQHVFLPDTPSLLIFLREFAPTCLASAQAAKLEAVEHTLVKMFRVQHGHDLDSVCKECDPDAWKRLQASRAKKARESI